ncbi:hypothetical protein B0H13DRAFT_1865656 [Mycena leptocephala]|nr:hypothetical protein B0H13DRAFT_1865656 [Mycena leptocephala]
MSSRRTQRRVHKSDHLMKVVEPYAAEYGLDPVVLQDMIHHEYLSDEVSGPKEETGESFEVWWLRMAALADLSVAPASLERLQILEVLVPEWRTDPYSDIIHDLEQRWYHTLTPKQKRNIPYDRVSTKRISPRIPMYAPHNFGFSEDWLKRNRKDREKRELLADWGKYSEPEDSGISAFIANRGAAIRGDCIVVNINTERSFILSHRISHSVGGERTGEL